MDKMQFPISGFAGLRCWPSLLAFVAVLVMLSESGCFPITQNPRRVPQLQVASNEASDDGASRVGWP